MKGWRMSIKPTNSFARFGMLYLLLAPTLLLILVFNLAPFFWAFALSLFNYEVGGTAHFVGLQNYGEFLKLDPTFWPSMFNMAFLTGFGLAVNLAVPLIVARFIFALRSERASYLYRILFLIPIVVPGVAIQLIWGGMIYSDDGLLNSTLSLIGLGHWVQGWLSSPRTALGSLAFIGFPFVNGINTLIFYAGLSNIPQSVHEAAELDGANGVRKFFAIDLPLLLSQIKLILILSIIAGIQGFEGIFMLTRGGPGFATMVPGLWMYFNAFSFQRMGYACAIGVILFLLILVFTTLNNRYFKSAESLQGIQS
jgi:raffinose/stachyose/melibiose transport system permease protein